MKFDHNNNNKKQPNKVVVSSGLLNHPSPHIKKHQLKRRQQTKALQPSNKRVRHQMTQNGGIRNNNNDSMSGDQYSNKHEQQQQQNPYKEKEEKVERITNLLPLLLKVEGAIQIYIAALPLRKRKRQTESHAHEFTMQKFRSIIRKAISAELSSLSTSYDVNTRSTSREELTNNGTNSGSNQSQVGVDDDTSRTDGCNSLFDSLELDEKIIVLFLFITNDNIIHSHNHNKNDKSKDNNNQNESRKILSYSNDLSKIIIHQNTTFSPPTTSATTATETTKRQSRMDVISMLYHELCQDDSPNNKNIQYKWKQNKEHSQLVQSLSKQVRDCFRPKKGIQTNNKNEKVNKNSNGDGNMSTKTDGGNTISKKVGHESTIATMAKKLFGTKNSSQIEEQQHQQQKHQQSKQSISSSKISSKIVEPYIKPNMTLEERVRARAEHSRRSQSQYKSQEKKNGNSSIVDSNGKRIPVSSVRGTSNNNNLVLDGSGASKRKHMKITPPKPNDRNLSGLNLVPFADALRIYVNNFIKSTPRKSFFGTDNLTTAAANKAPKFISVSLNEVKSFLIQTVSRNAGQKKSLSITLEKATSSVGLSEKRFTSKEVLEVIQLLCQSVPEWVTMSVTKMKRNSKIRRTGMKGTGSSKASSLSSSSSAILRVCENISFQSIRKKLGKDIRASKQEMNVKSKTTSKDGENIDQKKRKMNDGVDSTISNKAKESESLITNSKEETISSNNSSKTGQPAPSLRNTTDRQNVGFRLSNNGNARKRSKLSLSATRRNNNNNNNNSNNKSTRIHPPVPSYMTASGNDENDSDSDEEEEDDDEDPAALLIAAGIQQTPKVRMNHNQHLTGADVDGGEVIHSTSTNPRGLKRMFSMLNAGDRI